MPALTATTDIPREVDELLARFVPAVCRALEAEVVGVYLWGSAVLGGYRPGSSDVDVLVLLDADPTIASLAVLAPLHAELVAGHDEWADRVEVAYVGRDSLQTFREHPHPIVRVSPGEPLNLREANHEWLIDWYQAREHGITLFGQPHEQVLPVISPDELRIEAKRQLAGWFARLPLVRSTTSYLAYVVLVAGRALHATVSGQQASKPAAAAWLASTFPEWSDLAHEAVRHQSADGEVDALVLRADEVARFVRWAVATCVAHPVRNADR